MTAFGQFLVGAAALGLSAVALGAPALTVTEIYMGVAGNDVTEDWFELTNLGDMAWDTSSNPLWYDDVSADTGDAVPILGLGTIDPGESSIVVIGDPNAAAAWFSAWDNGSLASVAVGTAEGGSGLGQSGDGVTVFDDIIGAGNIVASQGYAGIGAEGSTLIYNPLTHTFGDNAQDGVFGAYSAPGGPAGDSGEFPLIGSPGVVPEPSTLLLLALAGLAIRRR